MAAPSLPERHRAARLLNELRRPAGAAIVARLPARPGLSRPAEAVREESGLPIKVFWTTVGRLEALGLLRRDADGLMVDHDRLDRVVDSWTADSPLNSIMVEHPRLRSFVQWGRITRMPTEPALIEELYELLGRLFDAGETMIESDVNDRLAAVHDDPAEARRALVDRGLLRRAAGSAIYVRP